MIKYFFLFLINIIFSSTLLANDNLLTIQQQLDRLQREVSDLSQTVFSKIDNVNLENESDMVTNLSSIDMRIYDLEKDLKNLNSNFEEIIFKFEDILSKIENFEKSINLIDENLIKLNNSELTSNKKLNLNNENNNEAVSEENTLGTLKIASENTEPNDNLDPVQEEENIETEVNLSPEEQFQAAFDYVRKKDWDLAKKSLDNFIINNPENQLAGSAHYWLGELYILEKKYRDAALIFAEGYQKFPKSIKAPDMLFKLSESLYNVDKVKDSCKTLEKLNLDYPNSKFKKNALKNIKEYKCLISE